MSDQPLVIDVEDYLRSINATNYLEHYGTPRRSGRYPWGSGGDDEAASSQRNKAFLDHVLDLKKQGLSDVEIARGMGITTTELRTAKSIAKNAQKAAQITMIERLAAKNYSNVAIGEKLGIPESSVRALRAEGVKDKVNVLEATASVLQNRIKDGSYLDVGTGVEYQLGISRQKLDTAIALLREQGYAYEKVQTPQLGTSSNKTTLKVLAPPGTTYRDIVQNMDRVRQVKEFSEDGGRSYLGIKEPLSISSKRVKVIYDEDGGSQADGVIYVRPGVDDVSIGNARYAQVRMMVDGTHYLKGMAIYKDDLPPGVDIAFNTNKRKTDVTNDKDAMKPIKDDPENPFGATIRQRIDAVTGKVTSAMNIVGFKEGSGEEGSWEGWARNLPSQFLSKQSPALAKQQLDVTYERKREELEGIMRLTNPAVKRKLLESYSDEADSAAVHLKAAALPRQSTHVILPVNKMKDTEVYAPNFRDGERVALVRFPHGGTFEIPELTVNNRQPDAIKLLGKTARDAIGINHRVAERLSGADFDGDTVLVIPNNSGRVQSTPALQRLKTFDAKREYAPYDGMRTIDGGTYNATTKKVEYPAKGPSTRNKGSEMGQVSNLITDMTIKGASFDEIAQAVKHSMVVIDAEKHALNYKQSYLDNGIAALKQKYQGGTTSGASTLISRATSRMDVDARRLRRASDGGPIDPKTGQLVYTKTGEHWIDKDGNTVYRKQRSTKLAEADDARTLSSGTKMEDLYANHSNRMKTLANEARKGILSTPPTPYSPSAKKAYASEVATLNAKLARAIESRPLERQAQVFANTQVRARTQANPNMSADELKKLKFQALEAARARTGAGKDPIYITDSEWSAIQAGAIRNAKLDDILTYADLTRVKQLATPKQDLLMTSAKARRAETMMRLGYSQAEIADQLGVSLTTLKRTLNE